MLCNNLKHFLVLVYLLFKYQNNIFYTKIISDRLPATADRRPAQNAICDVTQKHDVTQTSRDVTTETDQEAERDEPLVQLSELVYPERNIEVYRVFLKFLTFQL